MMTFEAHLHTLWLSIRSEAENWLFEIAPREERPIVVGTLLRAHVRIDQPGIKPVHLQFERAGNALRAVPALGAEIRVDGKSTTAPQLLAAYATIEFAGVKFETYVLDAELDSPERLQLREWARRELQCRSELGTAHAGSGHEVKPAWQNVRANSSSVPTETFRPLCDAWLNAPGAVIERGRHAAVDVSTLSEPSEEKRSDSVAARSPTRSKEVPLPVPSRAWFQVAPGATAPIEGAPAPRSFAERLRRRAKAALVLLGVLARDKPLLVSLVVVTGATTLMLAMLGIRQCVRLFVSERLVVHQHAATPAVGPHLLATPKRPSHQDQSAATSPAVANAGARDATE